MIPVPYSKGLTSTSGAGFPYHKCWLIKGPSSRIQQASAL